MINRILLATALLLLLAHTPAHAVGFQWANAPDPGNDPLQVAIWYPSTAKPTLLTIGPFDMQVAQDAKIAGTAHPLIVFTHGTGGMALNSNDTAIALAQAGFVVAAVTHTGDNYRDQSVSFTRQNFANRPLQVSRVIDFMLQAWPGHAAIDPARIGVFGHSAGGNTALILAGGRANMAQAAAFCRTAVNDWGCDHARQHPTVDDPLASVPIVAPDPRVKAIVIAAPAVSIAFEPGGLSTVKIPVQLWVGTQDAVVTDASRVARLLPARPDLHRVPNGGHFAYLTPCGELMRKTAPEICQDPNGFGRAKFLRGFHRSVIAFFQARLQTAH